jgi:hypothetical protein
VAHTSDDPAVESGSIEPNRRQPSKSAGNGLATVLKPGGRLFVEVDWEVDCWLILCSLVSCL